MEKLYANIQELLKNNLLRDEEPKTKALIEKLRHVKANGYFTKPEFLEMCKWKDTRQLRRSDWEANTESEVGNISTQAFATDDEYKRMILLDRLRGVGIPIASAILTLTDPQAYGVIDKRVWQLLYLYGEVDYDPEGEDLSTGHWTDYLPKLRQWASEFEVDVRSIERSLFEYHKTIQEDPLYK
jgi:thermostable 8-oxoguanine DNA glycosylase